MVVQGYLKSLIGLFFPRCCPVCKRLLTQKAEEGICLDCLLRLPRTRLHQSVDNEMECMLRAHLPLKRATAYFYYEKGNPYTALLHQLKYKGKKELGKTLGRYLAMELMDSDFFDSIDGIIPVPLHPDKYKKRGYNQSEWIARGIAQVTGLPVHPNAMIRLHCNETQTHQSVYGRWESVNGLFRLNSTDDFSNQHILLVDDVLTTGATLTACAEAFASVKNVQFSVLTLSKTQHS